MSDIINLHDNQLLNFSISDESSFEDLHNIGIALSSLDRLRILKLLSMHPFTLSELSKTLNIAVSSISYHINALMKAGLIVVQYQPGIKGHTKLCSKAVLRMKVDFDNILSSPVKRNMVKISMPIGNFIECNVLPPCGMVDETHEIEKMDTPDIMFSPERIKAQLLWFQSGYVSYAFPNHFLKSPNTFKSIDFSMELCSETTNYRNDWPSDITIFVNDVEIATYTSPGDFGGRRGKFTPEYWFINSTQYGLLKHFTIDSTGAYIDNSLKNKSVTFDSLELTKNNFIKLTIGIKPNAVHVGGINLFGEKFGDYNQSIIMTLSE